MRDQAQKLRQMVSKLEDRERTIDRKYTRIITITSGKGGVGKTSFTTNLGVYLGKIGYKVIIIDGDFGLANVDLMLGINSRYGLREVISGRMDLEQAMVEGPYGVKFMSGGSGIKELVNLEVKQLEAFLDKIDDLSKMADIILIDTGAGATDNIVKMVLAAHEVILLATPEPTAITDAYALTKIISSIRRDIVLNLVMNKVESRREAENIFRNFTRATGKFLRINVGNLGYIYDDFHVSKSIKEQTPYVLSYPRSQAAKQVEILAKQLLQQKNDGASNGDGMASYIKRLLNLFNVRNKH